MTRIGIPEFSDQQAADAAKILYHIEGLIKRLNGDRDLNFLIESAAGQVVFKIANGYETATMLECQHDVFNLLSKTVGDKEHAIQTPITIHSVNGNPFESVRSASGKKHFCRAVRFVSGRLLSVINPQTPDLLESLGETVAEIDIILADFKHNALERALVWTMHDAIETLEKYKPLLDDERVGLVGFFQNRFTERVIPLSDQLPFGAIHNDINDHNVIVAGSGHGQQRGQQRIGGIIDYGDMVYSWQVVDVAVAAAYAMLGKVHPLDAAASVIKGYHRKRPLSELEISVLFELMCMRLCMSVCICAYQQSQVPDNAYLRISEQSAWETLQRLRAIPADFAHYLFRDCCGLPPVPITARVINWLRSNSAHFKSLVNVNLKTDDLLILDASVGSAQMPNPGAPMDPIREAKNIVRAIDDQQCVAAIGKYDEYRLIYNGESFTDGSGHRRTLHLGIDVFMPTQAAIYAPLSGTVYGMDNDDAPLSYGGVLILKHDFSDPQGGGTFYTLYGHLKPASLAHHAIGDAIKNGQKIADIGEIHENGNWPPHVHFQIITDMLGKTNRFIGVGAHAHRNVWLNLCPDANLMLGIPDNQLSLQAPPINDPNQLAEKRATNRQPIYMARGSMQYLYDYTGRQYLDALNHVAHVGHCHPSVVAAMQQQGSVLNTNTGYSYAQIARYSERLLAKLSAPLTVCFLVNSGNEANHLALRLARNYTGCQDSVILEHANHANQGNLNNGAGGVGADHIHTALMPNLYRDRYRRFSGNEAATMSVYLDSIKAALQRAGQSGVAAFIAESMLGCAGQIILPEGYLSAVYQQVRDCGGLCIADEVQTGFGRAGSHYWAFETQDVVPDILTLGEPMGNGHPFGVVMTTLEIADGFNHGMDGFNISGDISGNIFGGNTFGGNPLSCAIGNAVLDVIEQENLQQHAADVGTDFHQKLNQLKSRYPIIGDVRGLGLFLGIELVNNHHDLQPAPEQANYIVERMKQKGILTATSGARHNVLKITPPLCFSHENVEQFTAALEGVLKEDFAQPSD